MTRITTALPETGFVMPSAAELSGLHGIVTGAHPWAEQAGERDFANAFHAVGLMYRLPEPDPRRFFVDGHVVACNGLLDDLGLEQTNGVALLAAILAHADVPWREANPRIGQLLEVGLHQYSGRPCSNRWRQLLSGEADLLLSVPPVARTPEQRGLTLPVPKFFRLLADGSLMEIGADESLWR